MIFRRSTKYLFVILATLAQFPPLTHAWFSINKQSPPAGQMSNLRFKHSVDNIPTWEQLSERSKQTDKVKSLLEEARLREIGAGAAHTDAKLRLFGSTGKPRVILYRDTAAWYLIMHTFSNRIFGMLV